MLYQEHTALISRYPPPTELLDLQPLPLTALNSRDFQRYFAEQGVKVFNPIQTQV